MKMARMFLSCLGIAIILNPVLAKASSIQRNDPRLPIHGTKNWELLNGHGFTPRHSHATTVFRCPDKSTDSCIWLTGGYSESHRRFDVQIEENENSDVWWSKDGASWNQVTEIFGDFLQGIGNGDAKVGGYVAPWYSRYGHSLNALDGDGDGIADVLVLAGGFSPIPSNDVWISKDGITWRFDGYAPWPKRAYHGAAVFQGKLWILGGTQLTNDVWAGRLVKDSSRDIGYRLVWDQVLPPNEAPWTPRAGFCVVTQLRQDSYPEQLNVTETSYTESMFIIGGLAVAEDDPLISDNGTRTRNDVWKTADGVSWEQVVPPSGTAMPWSSRAFHSCVTWHSLEDRSRWVRSDPKELSSTDDHWSGNNHTIPRMFITGGGYMGTNGNNEVRELEAYTDTWWSYDGADWVRVNYEEGSKHENNLYSTNEWTEADIGGRKVYRGKWGHSLEAFYVSEDFDSEVSNSINACAESENATTVCEKITSAQNKIPALFVIGGKLESESMVSDVFISKPGIHCELDGITCNGNGRCGQGNQGCM